MGQHWSDEQDTNIDEAVSPELLEGWNYGPDELERISEAEAYAAELQQAELDAEAFYDELVAAGELVGDGSAF